MCFCVSGILLHHPWRPLAWFNSKHPPEPRACSLRDKKGDRGEHNAMHAVQHSVPSRQWHIPTQAGDVSALTVGTSLRNADVTWREVRTPLFCCQAAERRVARFASFLSNNSVTRPRRPPDRRFINFAWAGHLLTSGGQVGEQPRLPCTAHWKCQSWARKVIVVVRLPNIASLQTMRALTFISQQRRRRTCL